jgi:hypothetical protein
MKNEVKFIFSTFQNISLHCKITNLLQKRESFHGQNSSCCPSQQNIMAYEFLPSVPLFIKSMLWRFYQGKFEFSLPFSSGSERSILVHFVRSVINNRVQVWHDRPQIKPIHNPWSQMVPQQNMKIDRRKIENKMSKQNMKIQRTKIENKMSY